MTHDQVQTSDMIDRYVRHDLPQSEAEAFEEHFFTCDACFAEVAKADALANSVRRAGLAGFLEGELESPSQLRTWTWMPLAASLVMGMAAGWAWLVTIPALRVQLASTQVSHPAPAPTIAAASPAIVNANVPVAILTAERSVSAPQSIVTPEAASEIVLWIEAPATASADGARLEVLSNDGAAQVAAVPHLARNVSGAYVASLPTAMLPAGSYRVRLHADSSASAALLGEYVLIVKAGR